ncbi:MAG: GNAT family N-acetyltransferase [Aureisphaera sp.]
MKTSIETERLVLREITFADKEDLFQLHTDPEVQKYTGEPVVETMEEIEEAIRVRHFDYATYGYGRMATILKETNEFIGWAGLTYLPEFDKVDLGYRFKKEYWGKGYATEASEAILHHGFRVLNLDLIIAIAMPDNKASFKIMEKVGMHFDKQAPYDETIQDAIWYRLDRTDYVEKAAT